MCNQECTYNVPGLVRQAAVLTMAALLRQNVSLTFARNFTIVPVLISVGKRYKRALPGRLLAPFATGIRLAGLACGAAETGLNA